MARTTALVISALAVCAALGCRFDESGLAPAPADGPMAAADAPRSTPDANANAPDGGIDATSCTAWNWSPTNLDECDPRLPAPGPALILSAGLATFTLNTDDGSLAGPGVTSTLSTAQLPQTGGPDLRVVVVSSLTIGPLSTLDVTGALPLVFVVWGDVLIDGRLAVDGRAPDAKTLRAGAGADLACGAGIGSPGLPSSGDGGGGGAGGGGYQDNGGDGGDGHGMGKGTKGRKGDPNGDAALSPLRGGCSGGAGGAAFLANSGVGGGGGGGGGAVQIIARDELRLTGTVSAAGGGGDGGKLGIAGGRGGGGGGGSGGAIFLEADDLVVTLTSFVCANGGSGGEGSDKAGLHANGTAGSCSEILRSATLNISGDGGDGGDGGYKADLKGKKGANGASESGGGGGGGSAGRVRFRGASTLSAAGGTISPPEAP